MKIDIGPCTVNRETVDIVDGVTGTNSNISRIEKQCISCSSSLHSRDVIREPHRIFLLTVSYSISLFIYLTMVTVMNCTCKIVLALSSMYKVIVCLKLKKPWHFLIISFYVIRLEVIFIWKS